MQIQRANLTHAFEKLHKKGILDKRLLGLLWEGVKHQEQLLQLMCKCNVFVPLTCREVDSAQGAAEPEEWLVPALLRNTVPAAEQGLSSFFILFPHKDTLLDWKDCWSVEMDEAAEQSRYPHGVFESLLAEVLQTSRALSFVPVERMELTRFHGKFAFKTHRLNMTLLEDKGMVEVVMKTPSVHFVMEQLDKKARELVLGMSPNTESCLAVPADGSADGPYREYQGSLVLVDR